jgi:membrane associated rhomboid family serine protease
MQKLPTEEATARHELASELQTQGKILGGFVGLLWLIQIVNAIVFGGALVRFGVEPRTLHGLVGILFAPLLHGSFAHLIANTVPLLVLGWFVMLRRKRDLLTVGLLSALVGGLGTWLIAPALSVHIGASVLVFGLLGYLLARGVFERRFWPIVGSVVTFFLYGGALFGVLPGQLGISWQGHLFGLLGGILAARLLQGRATEPSESPALPVRVAAPRGLASRPVRIQTKPEDDEIEAELERARAQLRGRSMR